MLINNLLVWPYVSLVSFKLKLFEELKNLDKNIEKIYMLKTFDYYIVNKIVHPFTIS